MLELANKCSLVPLGMIFALSLSQSKERHQQLENWLLRGRTRILSWQLPPFLTGGRTERLGRTEDSPTLPQCWQARQEGDVDGATCPKPPCQPSGPRECPHQRADVCSACAIAFCLHLWEADLKCKKMARRSRF